MLKFAWRWIQVGDPVLVHNRDQSGWPLEKGTVALVRRTGKLTHAGVRIDGSGDADLVWPGQPWVHSDPIDPADDCWLCQHP